MSPQPDLATWTTGQYEIGDQASLIPAGALDGMTVMRYAQIYRRRTSGGVEQYLRNLNTGLLFRHRMTVLQTHLVTEQENDAIEIEDVGVGRILWVPIRVHQSKSRWISLPQRVRHILSNSLRHSRREVKSWPSALGYCIEDLFGNGWGHLRYGTAVFSDYLIDLLGTHKVDLLALHWISYDARPLLSRASQSEVPAVLINHFDNARLLPRSMRKWINGTRMIGTVSGQGIPDDLQVRCVTLSDAIDTEFFSSDVLQPKDQPANPVVLLPARICDGKGHADLIQAVRLLNSRSLDLVLCFIGAVDSQHVLQELRRSIKAVGIEERVFFLGEKSPEEVRDWYKKSSVVVLPSYSEGLPRILIEAQAMGRVVVAYDSGGVREALMPNITGFLIETGNVNALADKIELLLRDPDLRLRMGRRGRAFVLQRFSTRALVQRHEAFYLKALTRSADIFPCHSTEAGELARKAGK